MKLIERLEYVTCDDSDRSDIARTIIPGMDEACVGIASSCGAPDRLVYDYDKLVDAMREHLRCDYQGAVDYIEYNIANAHTGANDPLILYLIPEPSTTTL